MSGISQGYFKRLFLARHVLCSLKGTVSCRVATRCVYSAWLLDGYNDCGDWSDEGESWHGTSCHPCISDLSHFGSDVCFLGNATCPNGSTCVPSVQTANYSCRCKNGAIVAPGGICSNRGLRM